MSKIYTVKETAEILKCNVNRVYELIDLGLLTAMKLGRIKITEQSLNEFLENYDGMDLSDPKDIKKI